MSDPSGNDTSADEPHSHDHLASSSSSRGSRTFRALLRRIATVLLVLVVVACCVAIAVVRSRAGTIGFDYANVWTFLLTLLVLVMLVPIILLGVRVPLSRRLMAVSVVVLLICFPLLTLRLDGFNGRLVPIVHWRWATGPAPLIDVPTVAQDAGTVDLATHTAEDFPQFLGPERSPYLPNVQLDRDWEANAPALLWRRGVGAGWSGFSAVNGFAVTMEQRGPNEVVTCYSVDTGDVMWVHSHAARHDTVMGGLGPRSTPTIDNGRVYALGATGILVCLEGATGTLVWSDDILKRGGVSAEEDLAAVSWGRAASPLVVHDLLIVPLGGPLAGPYHSLVAFDKETGALRWVGGDEQAGYASPSFATLCDVQQVLIVNESSVTGHRLDDGDVLWRYPWDGKSNAEANCSQAVALPDHQVLLTNRRKSALLQLAPAADGSLLVDRLWLGRNKLKTKFTNVVVHDGFIYGLSDGILECIERSTGKRRWKTRRGDYGHGQILGVGDLLLIQAESGEVVLVELNPTELVERGRFEALSERTWNTLCLYGTRLLVRNASEAACYRLTLRKTAD